MHTVRIDDRFVHLAETQIKLGRYESVAEVVRTALRLWEREVRANDEFPNETPVEPVAAKPRVPIDLEFLRTD